jgi:glucose uptake protein GlcU
MNKKIIQIAVYIAILVGIYFFLKRFPEESIIIFGIGLILIVGNWLSQADRSNN